MMEIKIDVDKWIEDMENSKYLIDGAYASGVNDTLDYYIRKLKELKKLAEEGIIWSQV